MTSKQFDNINVVGLGYIGLPTAAILATAGYKVTGIDTNITKVELVNKGLIDIVEPGLAEIVQSSVDTKRLVASTNMCGADIFLICVPTPMEVVNGIPSPNLSYVYDAVHSILSYIKHGDLIILESTSPVGTTDHISTILSDNGFDEDTIDVAYCPERVLPGNTLDELINNDRLVGGINDRSGIRAKSFYETFVKGEVIVTNAKTAELSKLTENSFRDVNIAFANELSLLCDKYEIDVFELIKLSNRHPRVNINQPGAGVGGHCIPVDPWFIVSQHPDLTHIISTARHINDQKPDFVKNKIDQRKDEFVRQHGRLPTIACFGLSFKADIDDLRGSPALGIVQRLTADGNDLIVVEPNVTGNEICKLSDLNDALERGDIFVVLVAHKQFKAQSVKTKLIESNALIFCDLS